MPFFAEIYRRAAHLFGRRTFENDLETELRFHLETRADDLQASGLTRRAALSQARREFGSADHMREEVRAAWRFAWLEDLASDLRYAARGFRRNPAFALTAIVCLALGIGANTTIFSVAQEALFSRPAVRDPATMLFVKVGGMSHIPMPDFRFLRDSGVFDALAGENAGMQANWRTGDRTFRIFAAQVTDNYFDVTGVPLAMGRGIQPGDTDVAVVTTKFWRQRLASDPEILGRKLIFDGRPFTVIGLLPATHRDPYGFGIAHDVYIPVSSDRTAVSLYARTFTPRPILLSRLTVACQELDRLRPIDNKRAGFIRMSPISGIGRLAADSAVLPVAAFFAMLMVVVGLVLLIACANVASLLLARASSRSQELAIRLSIGAGRGRIIRQLLAESLLLGLCGAAAGLVINLAAVSLLAKVQLPLPVPIQLAVEPDWRLLAYAAVVALASGLIAGLAPAFQGTRAGLAAALKRDERQVAGGRWNLRNTLVVVQISVSIVLLCAGFIFTRNLAEASRMNPGFDLERTVWASMRLVPESYQSREKIAAFIDTALDRLRATPGIDSAAILRVVPFNDEIGIGSTLRTDLNPAPVHVDWYHNEVSPDYFRTMAIPILAGRDFRRSDHDAVMINENLARKLFGAANPIGHTLQSEALGGSLTIVGVARNSSYLTLSDDNALAIYVPYALKPVPGLRDTELHFMVRAASRADAIVSTVRVLLDRLDPSSALEVRPMRGALTFALLPSQAGALVLGIVGLLGLTLAAVGLYGVLLYTVSRRIREIGLRVALGATPRSILELVLRHSLSLVCAGIAVGMLLSVVAVRPLAMFLIPDVRPTDPLNFVAVGAVLCAVAALATIAPAVRALRVDPLTALRHE